MPARLSLDENLISEMYNDGKSMGEIGKCLGVSRPTVKRRLIECGISIRMMQETRYGHTKVIDDILPRDLLYKEYIVNKKSTRQIASQYGVYYRCVPDKLKKYNISARGIKGKDNPRYGKPCAVHASDYKWHKYRDVFGRIHSFQGSYELAFAEWLDRNKIRWVSHQGIKRFKYFNDEGVRRTYGPDFYLPEYDYYIEIKGYFRDNARRKMQIIKETYPGYKILILFEKDLKEAGVV